MPGPSLTLTGARGCLHCFLFFQKLGDCGKRAGKDFVEAFSLAKSLGLERERWRGTLGLGSGLQCASRSSSQSSSFWRYCLRKAGRRPQVLLYGRPGLVCLHVRACTPTGALTHESGPR